MTETVPSINKVPIRLTDERWPHITEEHCELADMKPDVLKTVAHPLRIVEGRAGELLAQREVFPGRHLVVVYREEGDDGFIITAFLTTRPQSLDRRRHVWPLKE